MSSVDGAGVTSSVFVAVEPSLTDEASLLGNIHGVVQGAALNAALLNQTVEGLVVVDDDGLCNREESVRRIERNVIPRGDGYHLDLSLTFVALLEDLLEHLFEWGSIWD